MRTDDDVVSSAGAALLRRRQKNARAVGGGAHAPACVPRSSSPLRTTARFQFSLPHRAQLQKRRPQPERVSFSGTIPPAWSRLGPSLGAFNPPRCSRSAPVWAVGASGRPDTCGRLPACWLPFWPPNRLWAQFLSGFCRLRPLNLANRECHERRLRKPFKGRPRVYQKRCFLQKRAGCDPPVRKPNRLRGTAVGVDGRFVIGWHGLDRCTTRVLPVDRGVHRR